MVQPKSPAKKPETVQPSEQPEVQINENDIIEEKEDVTVDETEYSVPKAEHYDSRHVVIVHNEIQSSSCVLYYLECATNNPQDASTLELFFNLIQVRMITALKHVVTLGYVVGCDIRKIKDRLGFRIIGINSYFIEQWFLNFLDRKSRVKYRKKLRENLTKYLHINFQI